VSSKQLHHGSVGFASTRLDGFHIIYHPDTSISLSSWGTVKVAIIGEILDPIRPEATNEDVAEQLARCPTTNALFKQLSELTGRFVCVYASATEQVAVSDAIALRQVIQLNALDGVVFGSSPKLLLTLLGLSPQTTSEKLQIIRGLRFRVREHAWLGSECEDDRLVKVLPNHYLDLVNGEIHRIPPIGTEVPASEPEVLDFAERTLKGGYHALRQRFQLHQPLTAGWDSRILLGASRELAESVKFYMFDRSGGTHPDATVPAALARMLGLEFRAVAPRPMRDDFIEAFKAEHLYPRILPKTEDIQHHWLERRIGGVVNVSTIGAEIARGF